MFRELNLRLAWLACWTFHQSYHQLLSSEDKWNFEQSLKENKTNRLSLEVYTPQDTIDPFGSQCQEAYECSSTLVYRMWTLQEDGDLGKTQKTICTSRLLFRWFDSSFGRNPVKTLYSQTNPLYYICPLLVFRDLFQNFCFLVPQRMCLNQIPLFPIPNGRYRKLNSTFNFLAHAFYNS